MEIRDILCVVDHTDEAESAFRYAANLARFHDANLFALCPIPDLPASLYMATQFNREWIDIFVQQHKSEAGRLFNSFSKIALELGVEFEWRDEQGEPEQLLEKHSRLMDLVVMAKSRDKNTLAATDTRAGTHLLEIDIPTIILPTAGSEYTPPKNILVAWDGSKSASRAVRESMLFLSSADQVRVITIVDEDSNAQELTRNRRSSESVARYLARHEVNADCAEVVIPAGSNETAVIMKEIDDFKCHLLVMGAYGHSRLREVMLGGMTRAILAKTRVPVFMVH